MVETRIFAVDDSNISRRILKEVLLAGGYEHVDFAASGMEALARLGVEPAEAPSMPEPHAILLDVVMPGIDGIETVTRIRADGRYQHTPILMVTSEAEMDSLAQAFVAGANDYVRKPFNTVELLARLRNALRLKGEIDRRRERERELVAATREIRAALAGGTAFDAATMLPGRAVVDAYFAHLPAIGLNGLGVLAMQIDDNASSAPGRDAAENALISRVSSCLAALPSYLGDILARYEGGMFVALMQVASVEELGRRAEAARQAVLRLQTQKTAARNVTLSIGAVHGSAAQNCDPRMLLASAVSAMEHAAFEGGNRIVIMPAAET